MSMWLQTESEKSVSVVPGPGVLSVSAAPITKDQVRPDIELWLQSDDFGCDLHRLVALLDLCRTVTCSCWCGMPVVAHMP